jgi:hypothetical protein
MHTRFLLTPSGLSGPGCLRLKRHERVRCEIGSNIKEKWVYPPANFCYHAPCRKTWGTRQTLKELLFGESALNALLGGIH